MNNKSNKPSLRNYLMVVFCCTFFVLSAQTNQLSGSWELQVDTNTHILLLSGNYFTWTIHTTSNGAFQMTKGGSWTAADGELKLNYEFHTVDTTQVGQSETIKFTAIKNGDLKLRGKGIPKGTWNDLDKGQSTPLSGPWLFSGRKRDGEISRRDTDRPRKTMKVLTGTRFQWIAYNTETKRFYGTGGGTYTAKDGQYIEVIKFFSRDNSRVGAELKFEFEVKDGDWNHSGKSSKGDPLYEFWSPRK